jgi:hypothetical protein
MKKSFACLLAALALLLVSTGAGRADQFDRIETSSDTYWVPAPTPPPPTYASAPPPAYYGPPPPAYYYGPPPPAVHFFFGFHFH